MFRIFFLFVFYIKSYSSTYYKRCVYSNNYVFQVRDSKVFKTVNDDEQSLEQNICFSHTLVFVYNTIKSIMDNNYNALGIDEFLVIKIQSHSYYRSLSKKQVVISQCISRAWWFSYFNVTGWDVNVLIK